LSRWPSGGDDSRTEWKFAVQNRTPQYLTQESLRRSE
jgi:hypothetical protein